jgi:hypothetical protein
MAIIPFSGGAGGNGHLLSWEAEYDDVERTLTFRATHTKFDGSPEAGPPQVAQIVVQLNNGQPREFDLLTATAPSDGEPGLINKGDQVFTNIRLTVGQGRSRVVDHQTVYQPPA